MHLKNVSQELSRGFLRIPKYFICNLTDCKLQSASHRATHAIHKLSLSLSGTHRATKTGTVSSKLRHSFNEFRSNCNGSITVLSVEPVLVQHHMPGILAQENPIIRISKMLCKTGYTLIKKN